ncbi:MAG: M48 family metallopeptidase [Candidatus Thiodiazotropha sp. (ex Lucinoma borealis)]|nr:M48 family metallopeptidase [Candidatus Thiodiazotropha sp. (ex Lucinoma borealis)]MCU7870513.1 M48 family metallopeptidase [Candidatus Thiodiazotropha sp. (ex Lucinoma borealis)]
MPLFTQLFLIFLTLGTLLQFWLLVRHLGHVAKNRGEVPLEFNDKVDLSDHQKAADYTQAKGKIATIEVFLGVALLLFWTLGGGLDLLDRYWRGYDWGEVIIGMAFIFSFFFISSLLDLPFSLYRTFRMEVAFGFNRITPIQYLKDHLLGILLALLLGGPLLWVILQLMESAGSYWWLAAWAVWMGFSLTLSWAYPRFVAPLFNTFTPLDEGEMRDRIQGLLQRCGFTSDGIFVMDGSKRSSHGNAYFTGFGKSKRIVFFDTLLEALNIDEMEAVLAHELGHFHHKHIIKQMALMGFLSLVGMALLGWLSQQPWFYSGLGITHPSNSAALLLFMLTIPVFTTFFTPLGSYLSRRYEFQADDYAINQTNGEFLVQALVKLYQDNASTLTPDPLYSLFHDSHPPAPVRIAHISQQNSG